jgi:hypothetical protein
MKKTIVFIILGIILLCVILNKTESFANSSTELSLIELENIKASIDKIADIEFSNAKNQIKENNIKILIDAFKESQNKDLSAENKKADFNSNVFVQNVLSDDRLGITNSFKQNIYIDLLEASVFDRNLNMIPLNLIATNKITSDEGMKKIGENLLPTVANITTTFVSYLLKHYDNSKPREQSRFNNSMITLGEINNIIKNKTGLFI